MVSYSEFSNLRDSNLKVRFTIYSSLFKQRLIDQFIQSWNTSLRTSASKLDKSRTFKTIFDVEKYIDVIQNDTL